MRQSDVNTLIERAIQDFVKEIQTLRAGNLALRKRLERLERELARAHEAPHLKRRPITPPKFPTLLMEEIGLQEPPS